MDRFGVVLCSARGRFLLKGGYSRYLYKGWGCSHSSVAGATTRSGGDIGRSSDIIGYFIKETLEGFAKEPTPPEIAVERAKMLRSAEAEGRFEQTFQGLNESARAARAAQ